MVIEAQLRRRWVLCSALALTLSLGAGIDMGQAAEPVESAAPAPVLTSSAPQGMGGVIRRTDKGLEDRKSVV